MKQEIHTAGGHALDRIGESHGVPRAGVEPDHDYRLRILDRMPDILEGSITMENSSMTEFRQAVQGLVDEGRLIVHASRAAVAVASRKTAWMIVIDLDGVDHFLAIQHGNCRWLLYSGDALRMSREADALAVLSLVGTGTKARAEEREFF